MTTKGLGSGLGLGLGLGLGSAKVEVLRSGTYVLHPHKQITN
jgi:hypothetical protein